ncbi:metallopeptidase family protein [Anianabacter salinae]|uniref:metallopeptidase family protein n=1 Tax=Anianabacter salinae TaxID=2851023 RepID=UPI00225E5CAE|nr:metallopeptidase family protein [Anianabacter salinae]MBV0910991.1 metallopeptidase family protein [Anianabacter salinae]
MDNPADLVAPDLAAFETLCDAARAAMPEPFASATREVRVRIEDFAPDDLLDDMEIDDPFGLTGLYDGVPLTQKSVMDQPMGPDTVWLFRRPILDEWAERGDVTLGQLVTHVLVHEMAHHLGWDDDDIASIDPWWL